jgi:hypothetical protein
MPWTWRINSSATSKPPPNRPIFVLDENFPEPILRAAIATWVLEVDLRALREFEPRLCGDQVEDWQVILGLRQRGAEALLTCDDNMLSVAQVVAVIEQMNFSVVSCRAVGHDPVAASGLLLAHLPNIAKRHVAYRPQVWRLRTAEQRPVPIANLKQAILDRSGVEVDDYRLSASALQVPLMP